MKNLFTLLGILFVITTNAHAQTEVTIYPPQLIICEGTSGTFSAVVPGYNPDELLYMWLQNGVIVGTTSSVMVSPPPGAYNITLNVILLSDSTWVGNGFATLTVNPLPMATASNSGPYCVNEPIQLQAGGGIGYVWTGPNDFTSNSQNPVLSSAQLSFGGTYTVTVTNSFGCSATATTQVVVNSLPTPTITVSNNTICLGTPVTFTATGGVSYLWSFGGSGATATYTPTTTGNLVYSVLATNSNGCEALEWVFITVNPTPAVTAVVNNVSCYGQNNGSAWVSASGGSSFSYIWSTGATTQSINNLIAGSYFVTVTNNFGCSTTATAVVTQPNPLVVMIANQTNITCFGNSNGSITVAATGGTLPYSELVQWSDGTISEGPTRTGLLPGTYTATITDANGCSASVTTTVTGPPSAMVFQWYTVQNPCAGVNNGGITVNVSGGVPPYIFTWSDGFVGPIRTGLGPGNYLVSVVDGNGCQIGPFGQILVANLAMTITTPTFINYCVGSGQTIEATLFGGTQPYAYQWTAPNGMFFGTSQSIEPIFNGQYMGGIWTLVVVDGLGCSTTHYITVNLVTCPPTSVGEWLEGQIGLYPNPSWGGQGLVTIKLPPITKEVQIQVIDMRGKTVFQDSTFQENYQISTSGLAAGTYMVQIATDNEVVVKRLVIK